MEWHAIREAVRQEGVFKEVIGHELGCVHEDSTDLGLAATEKENIQYSASVPSPATMALPVVPSYTLHAAHSYTHVAFRPLSLDPLPYELE